MPKYTAKKAGPFEWIALAALLALITWFVWRWPVLLLLVPLFIAINYRERQKRTNHYAILLRVRGTDSICTFANHFDTRKVDTWIVRAVYEQLQDRLSGERSEFPIRPTDDVFSDLLIDEEDFELDLVEEIAERTGRSLDGMEKNLYFGKASLVENLVYFFNQQPLMADSAKS
jgi:hypothetical protein